MQQLWLLGKRIDSIGQLQKLFAAADEETTEALCLRMLEHTQSGVLRGWLKRQNINGYIQNAGQKNAVDLLLDWDGEDAEQNLLCAALGVLCGVSEQAFLSPRMREMLDKRSTSARHREEILRKQSWWKEYEDLFRAVTDWNLVITDNSQLQLALETLPRAGQNTSGGCTLYLCNTSGKLYTIDLRDVYNTTIIGVADPRVVHRRIPGGQYIDAQAQGLVLRDMTLECPGWEYIIHHDNEKHGFTIRVQ